MSYRFPQIKDEPADQWGRAFTCMIDAEEEGKLDYQYRAFGATLHPGKMSYSDEKRLPSKVRLNMLNVQTMGEHLYLLGYLDKKPSENEPDLQESVTFQKAVRKFQKEANLTVDGWIGDETWRALHSLVGFESDTNIKQWQEGENTFCQAFYRAVQLRLWAYGMTKEQPTQKFDGLKEHAKKNFKEILWSFGALKRDENVSDFWLFSQLFDEDALLKMASASHDGHGSFFDEKLMEEKQKASLLMDNDFLQFIVPLKGCFIANLVKIEIWLLGGEAKIDGTGDYPVEGLGEWEKQDKYNHWDVMPHVARDVTRDALLKYWHETLGAKKNIRAITPEFLNSFLDPQSVKERTDTTKEEVFKDSDYSKKLLEELDKEKDKIQEKITQAFDAVKKLGMRLWDGMKRLWSWIKKGVQSIVHAGENLYRTIFRFAHKAYKAVRLAFDSFSLCVSQYMHKEVQTGTPFVKVKIESDFDTVVTFDPKITADELKHAQTSMKRFSAMFGLSCAIISVIVRLMKSALSGLLGWVRLVYTLLQSYREIKPYYRELSDLLS